MAVSASANALVTAAEATAYLGLGTLTGDDADNLQRQINAASAMIENWLGVPTIYRNAQEWHYGAKKYIYLRNYPVLAIISIVDPAGNVIPATDYIVENDMGRLAHFGRFWVAQTTGGQPTRWKFDHVAGWWAGNKEFTGSAGSGTFNVGNFIYVGASWAAATKKGCITKVQGTTGSPKLTYCLLTDSPDFASPDAVKEYTGTADGDATCTAAAPTDAAYVTDDAKQGCYTLVNIQRETGLTAGVSSVGVGSLSVSYGSAQNAFNGDSSDIERLFMQTGIAAALWKYRGNVAI